MHSLQYIITRNTSEIIDWLDFSAPEALRNLFKLWLMVGGRCLSSALHHQPQLKQAIVAVAGIVAAATIACFYLRK